MQFYVLCCADNQRSKDTGTKDLKMEKHGHGHVENDIFYIF